MIISLYVKDPQLIKDLDAKITSRKLAGEQASRSEVIDKLLREYLEVDDTEGVELPKVNVKVRNRIFLTIPSHLSWLPHTLAKVVEIKSSNGKKSSIQNEILVLATHGFLSDPTYGETLRSLLNDSCR